MMIKNCILIHQRKDYTRNQEIRKKKMKRTKLQNDQHGAFWHHLHTIYDMQYTYFLGEKKDGKRSEKREQWQKGTIYIMYKTKMNNKGGIIPSLWNHHSVDKEKVNLTLFVNLYDGFSYWKAWEILA